MPIDVEINKFSDLRTDNHLESAANLRNFAWTHNPLVLCSTHRGATNIHAACSDASRFLLPISWDYIRQLSNTFYEFKYFCC